MKAIAAGGIEAIVEAINTHTNNIGVCHTGCWALWFMALNNSKNTLKTNQQNIEKQLKNRSIPDIIDM